MAYAALYGPLGSGAALATGIGSLSGSNNASIPVEKIALMI